jgi:hypothetical protein
VDKEPLRRDNITREQLLNWPVGDKKHRVLVHPKTQPYKEAGGTVVWRDQWGTGIAKNLVQLFTRPGETVGDMCCGTGTLGYVALKMGRNVVAVDILEKAITTTDLRYKELKEDMEKVVLDGWETAHNPISHLSAIPGWATRDLSVIGAIVEKRDATKKAAAQAKAKKASDAKKAKKKAEKAMAESLAKLAKQQEAEAAAEKARAASAAASQAHKIAELPDDHNDEENDEDNDKENDDNKKDEMEDEDVGIDQDIVAPKVDQPAPLVNIVIDPTLTLPPLPNVDVQPVASPSVTRSNSHTATE